MRILRPVVLVVLIVAFVAPATAQGFGLQAQFADDGVNCCGEVVIFNGLALDAGGDVWTSIGPRGTLDRYTTGGAQQASIPVGDVSHGIAVDHVHGAIYSVYGHIHSGYGIKKFGLDGTPLLTFGTTSFTGDFNEGIAVAVNETTQEAYGVGAGAGGKIVRFAADGSVVRTLLPGVHPQDIEVDQVTGDVYVVNYDDSTVVRYDAALDNRTVLYTGVAHTNPTGLSLTGDGGFWVTWRGDNTAQRIAANGTSRGIASIPSQVMDVESDDHGGAWVSTGDAHTVHYAGTDPPAASFTTSHTGAVSRGTRVDFTSTATDADGNIAATTWDLDGDGTYGDAIGTTAGRTFASAGTYTVRMRVTDNDGATGVSSAAVTVVDGAPSPSFTISPAAPRPGDTVMLSSTSTDDGTITATEWDLDDDGQFDDGTGSPVTTSFSTVGTHHVRLRIMDDAFNQVTLDRAITVDPDPTELSASDATVTEGDAGSVQMTFQVTLATPSSHPVTVDYAVDPGTAADGTDFASRSLSTLTFAPGQTSKTIKVPVFGDVIDEADETVLLHLTDPDGATLADSTGTGTITDDDAPPTVSVVDTHVDEGPGTVAHVTVKLDGPVTERTASVTLATSDGTAHAPGDYTTVSQPVTIVPPARSATVDVPITDDDRGESDETVGLALTNTGPLPLGTTTATLTIHDGDPPDPITLVSAPPNPVPEGGGPVTAVIGLPFAASAPVTLGWSLAGGDTRLTSDWAATAGTVTIPAGQAQATITLTPVDDNADEEDVEPWVLSLNVVSGIARGTIDTPVGMTDDDPDAQPVICADCAEHEGGDALKPILTLRLDTNQQTPRPVAEFDRPSEALTNIVWTRDNGVPNFCGAEGWNCRGIAGLPSSPVPRIPTRPWPAPDGYFGIVDLVGVQRLEGPSVLFPLVGATLAGGPVYRNMFIQTAGNVQWRAHGQLQGRSVGPKLLLTAGPYTYVSSSFQAPDPVLPGDEIGCLVHYSQPGYYGDPGSAGAITKGATVLATGGSYTVRAADAGDTLHCDAAHANHPTLTVSRPPTVPKLTPVIITTKPLAVSSAGLVGAAPVSCSRLLSVCAGTLEYRAASTKNGARSIAGGATTAKVRKKKTINRRKGTLLGSAKFRVRGHKAKVKVKLSKAGLAQLAKTGSLTAIAVVRTGSKVSDRAVVLNATAPKAAGR